MASVNYDIYAKQDETLNFHVEYYDTNGTPVNLTGYSARFQVRSHTSSIYKYLDASLGGVTGGGITGEYLEGITMKNGITWVSEGVAGTGGIYLNVGETGGVLTGGIRLHIDYSTMGRVPTGTWVYGFDLIQGATVNELLSGRFVVRDKVVR